MRVREMTKSAVIRPYLAIDHLAKLTPWSEDAIRAKMRRGEFVEGVHYYRPEGHRGKIVFKWAAVVAYIEASQGSLIS